MKLLSGTVAALLLLLALAGGASAHSGDIRSSADCSSGSVTASLNHDVTPDRTVTITTTIPGTTGLSGHFDTTAGDIWTASGPQPFAGTVTLTIYNGEAVEFTTSLTVEAIAPCASDAPSAPPSAPPSPGGHGVTPPPSSGHPSAPPAVLTTPPPTDTANVTPEGADYGYIIAGILIFAILIGLMAVRRRQP